MRLVELRWRPYAVPCRLRRPARGAWRVRDGALLRITADTGTTGLGELAPLPSHGSAANVELLSLLEGVAPRLVGLELDALAPRIDALLGEGADVAPLRCALETAALDALARAAGVSLARLLLPDPRPTVAVNAVVDAATCRGAAVLATKAVGQGVLDIKLKVGYSGSPEAEVARVAAVREAVGPDIRVRIDANGAWSEAEAIATLHALEPYGIDLAEQPVPPGDAASLARVRAAVRTPIAADESVTGATSLRALIDARAVDAIVVKLPVVGGPGRARSLIETAAHAGVSAIVTSAFDTGVGVAAALQVAATLPRPARACGLATLHLLDDDLIAGGLRIDRGRMRVPDAPGLGVDVDEAALDRYGAGPERVVRA